MDWIDRIFHWLLDHPLLWIAMIFAIAIASAIIQTVFVYDGDFRCLVAECRIVKD